MKVKISILVAILICLGIASFIFYFNKNDTNEISSQVITSAEAKSMMEKYPDSLILDVRTQEEYDEGHIENAVIIPYDTLNAETMSKYEDKSQKILIYCRSGRRSAIAAQTLVDLGYSNVYDFGGIQDWTYETVK